MTKTSGIYKITNTITGDFYIGSSKNIRDRWYGHRNSFTWKRCSGMKIYKDMAQYGLNNFTFEIIEETANLREREQYWIGQLKPTYNICRANGLDIERKKERKKEWYEVHREECLSKSKEYKKAHQDKIQNYQRDYGKSHKKEKASYNKEYNSRLCLYKGETITLGALCRRFSKQKIPHPVLKAKKYLFRGIGTNYSI